MALRILYQEGALADLEEIFNWSRERHPGTTQQFADDLFSHLDLLGAFPYIGAPLEGHSGIPRLLHSPLYIYYRVDEGRGGIEILHFQHVARRQPGGF